MSENTAAVYGNQFRAPGDVKIQQLSLHRKPGATGISLIPFVIEIDLYEDIFSPTMSGTIVLSDSIGLSSAFPLIGGESIQIEFRTPECEEKHIIRKRFAVYKLEAKVTSGAKSLYVVHIISEFAYKDSKVRLSRKLSGNAVNIISDLLKNDLKVDFAELQFNYAESEAANNQINFISPNWSPLTIINRISSLCTDPSTIASDGEMAAYLFFEGNKGLNFWSLSSLTVQYDETSPKAIGNEYFFDQNPNRKAGMRDIKSEMQQIQDLRVDKQFDMIDRITTGAYRNQVIEFDILRKTATTLPAFDYMSSIVTNVNKMNKFPISPIGTDFGDAKLTAHTSFNQSVSPVDPSINPVKNRIVLSLMNSVVIEIVVHGRTDLEVGDQIYINMPDAINSEPGKSSEDKLISGNYVITAIQHRINEFKHSMIMRVSTDSYNIDISAAAQG